jgi:hypothetical protein
LADKDDDLSSLIAFVGDALSKADPIVKFLTQVLSFGRFLAVKYYKQQDQKEAALKDIRMLEHEMGAMGVLTKGMRRRAKNGNLHPKDFDDLYRHVRSADKVAKRIGLKVKDPPFNFNKPESNVLEEAEDNEPALLLIETLLDEISWYSLDLGSNLR